MMLMKKKGRNPLQTRQMPTSDTSSSSGSASDATAEARDLVGILEDDSAVLEAIRGACQLSGTLIEDLKEAAQATLFNLC